MNDGAQARCAFVSWDQAKNAALYSAGLLKRGVFSEVSLQEVLRLVKPARSQNENREACRAVAKGNLAQRRRAAQSSDPVSLFILCLKKLLKINVACATPN